MTAAPDRRSTPAASAAGRATTRLGSMPATGSLDLVSGTDAHPRPNSSRTGTSRAASAGVALIASHQQVWDFRSNPAGIAPYNAAYLWLVRGELNVAVAAEALLEVEHRHAVLRSRICDSDSGIHQVVRSCAGPAVSVGDLREVRRKRWRVLMGAIAADLRDPRELSVGVGFNPYIWRLGDTTYVLAVVVAHTAWDGGSIPVFLQDWMASYAAVLHPSGAESRQPATQP